MTELDHSIVNVLPGRQGFSVIWKMLVLPIHVIMEQFVILHPSMAHIIVDVRKDSLDKIAHKTLMNVDPPILPSFLLVKYTPNQNTMVHVSTKELVSIPLDLSSVTVNQDSQVQGVRLISMNVNQIHVRMKEHVLTILDTLPVSVCQDIREQGVSMKLMNALLILVIMEPFATI